MLILVLSSPSITALSRAPRQASWKQHSNVYRCQEGGPALPPSIGLGWREGREAAIYQISTALKNNAPLHIRVKNVGSGGKRSQSGASILVLCICPGEGTQTVLQASQM